MWLLVLSTTLLLSVSVADFSCEAFTWQGDIYFRSYYNGQGLFDYTIGAGGDIFSMRDNLRNYAQLISPPYIPGVDTDRVIQLVWWDSGITHSGPGIPDPRYNVNQAGTDSGEYSPTISATMNNYGTNNCTVGVYARPQDVWDPNLAPYMQGSYGMHTKYTATSDGWLRIRRTLLVDQAYLNGQPVPLNDTYIEAWSPFLVPTFNGLALAATEDGTPTWWYDTHNIPTYPAFPVDQTYGYAIVFTTSAPSQNVAVGMVYGTKQFVTCIGPGSCITQGNGASYVLNSMSFDVGICILPGMNPGPLQVGDVIDQQLILVPRTYFDQYMIPEVEAAVATVPAPTLYRNADDKMDAELLAIVQGLRANANATGQRVNNLGFFVS